MLLQEKKKDKGREKNVYYMVLKNIERKDEKKVNIIMSELMVLQKERKIKRKVEMFLEK